MEDQRPCMWTSARERVPRVLYKNCASDRRSFAQPHHPCPIFRPSLTPFRLLVGATLFVLFSAHVIPSRRRQNVHTTVDVAVIAAAAAAAAASHHRHHRGSILSPILRTRSRCFGASPPHSPARPRRSPPPPQKYTRILLASTLEPAAREISSHFFTGSVSSRWPLSLHFSSPSSFHSNQVLCVIVFALYFHLGILY